MQLQLRSLRRFCPPYEPNGAFWRQVNTRFMPATGGFFQTESRHRMQLGFGGSFSIGRVRLQFDGEGKMVVTIPAFIGDFARQVVDQKPAKSTFGQFVDRCAQIGLRTFRHLLARHFASAVNNLYPQVAAVAHHLDLDLATGPFLAGMFNDVVQNFGHDDFDPVEIIVADATTNQGIADRKQGGPDSQRVAGNRQPHASSHLWSSLTAIRPPSLGGLTGQGLTADRR